MEIWPKQIVSFQGAEIELDRWRNFLKPVAVLSTSKQENADATMEKMTTKKPKSEKKASPAKRAKRSGVCASDMGFTMVQIQQMNELYRKEGRKLDNDSIE